jgi:flavin reductase (DIM6/NTAB) family NADH-FMN oxidoreductase RutF
MMSEVSMRSAAAEETVDDALVPIRIKDNFYQSSSFFPMPFALITTTNEEGFTSIGPYSLVFPLDICEQHSMMLVSRASSNTATNLRRHGKCSLNYIEYDSELLKSVVELGYPGVPPEEKMRDIPFELIPSPTPERRDDPECPLLVKGAFQVFECEVDGTFDYKPKREIAHSLAEDYFSLRIKNILMQDRFKTKLEERRSFPNMPISFGFRGGNEFWFTQHNEPFNIKLPEGKGLDGQGIYRIATGLDSDISFTQEACDLLTVVPAPFVEAALSVFVKKAKEQNITEVDANFIKTADTRWSGKKK